MNHLEVTNFCPQDDWKATMACVDTIAAVSVAVCRLNIMILRLPQIRIGVYVLHTIVV